MYFGTRRASLWHSVAEASNVTDYVTTDTWGNTAASPRTVLIEAAMTASSTSQ